MDQATVAVYEARAGEWLAKRGAGPRDDLGERFGSLAGPGPVLDAGCGAGRYLAELPGPVFGMDAARAMLSLAARRCVPLVQGDLERLPFAGGSLSGVFARHSYLHVPPDRLALAVAEARRVLRAGGLLMMTLIEGDYSGRDLPGDDFPGRHFSLWSMGAAAGVVAEAGFGQVSVERLGREGRENDLLVTARRPIPGR